MKLLDRFDGWQRRHRVPGLVVGVLTKTNEDKAPALAALLAYYGFLSVFPLMLVLLTLLGLFFGHDPGLRADVVHSALAQFPIVGKELASVKTAAALRSRSALSLVFGLVGLAWGALGVTRAGQRALADVWNVPQADRPRFAKKTLRGLGFFGVLVLDVVVTTALAGLVTWDHHAPWLAALVVLAQLLVNGALFVVGFRVLTPASVPTRCLLDGALLAALGWSLLQFIGTWLVSHELRHANELYGYFASVLGLVSFLYVAAMVTVLAAETNVVVARRLYPRSLRGEATEADHRAWREETSETRRRREATRDLGPDAGA